MSNNSRTWDNHAYSCVIDIPHPTRGNRVPTERIGVYTTHTRMWYMGDCWRDGGRATSGNVNPDWNPT